MDFWVGGDPPESRCVTYILSFGEVQQGIQKSNSTYIVHQRKQYENSFAYFGIEKLAYKFRQLQIHMVYVSCFTYCFIHNHFAQKSTNCTSQSNIRCRPSVYSKSDETYPLIRTQCASYRKLLYYRPSEKLHIYVYVLMYVMSWIEHHLAKLSPCENNRIP